MRSRIIPQKQPNPWSCYPTAVSMVTGIPLSELVSVIGHDGRRIVNPEKESPECYEAFSQSEIAIALLKLGWSITPLCGAMVHENGSRVSSYPDFDSLQEWVLGLELPVVVTIEVGDPLRHHCLAWDGREGKVIDPLVGDYVVLGDDKPLKWFDVLAPLGSVEDV